MRTDTSAGPRLTLSALLELLGPDERLFIIHRLGPHEAEAVAEGTAQELKETPCVEVCGENIVEHIASDISEDAAPWDEPSPILIITIGGKRTIKNGN